jgi:hypothetical protein
VKGPFVRATSRYGRNIKMDLNDQYMDRIKSTHEKYLCRDCEHDHESLGSHKNIILSLEKLSDFFKENHIPYS